MKHWASVCLQPSTGRVGAAIKPLCLNLNILPPGSHVASPIVATSAGADACGSWAEPLAGSVSVLSRCRRACMKFISSVILSVSWWTSIQAVCVQRKGPKPRSPFQNHKLCPRLPPSPMSPPRAWKPALRSGSNTDKGSTLSRAEPGLSHQTVTLTDTRIACIEDSFLRYLCLLLFNSE